jgi:hypothetical protein
VKIARIILYIKKIRISNFKYQIPCTYEPENSVPCRKTWGELSLQVIEPGGHGKPFNGAILGQIHEI